MHKCNITFSDDTDQKIIISLVDDGNIVNLTTRFEPDVTSDTVLDMKGMVYEAVMKMLTAHESTDQ